MWWFYFIHVEKRLLFEVIMKKSGRLNYQVIDGRLVITYTDYRKCKEMRARNDLYL